MQAIPAGVLAAAGTSEPNPEYVAFVGGEHDEVMKWARCVELKDGSTRYGEVWLDANRIPHLTGKTVPITAHHIVPAVTWLHLTPPPDPDKAGQEDDHDAPPGFAPGAHAGVIRIAGAENNVFPLNGGWSLPGSKHTKLTEIFSIHNMTQYLTRRS